MKTRFYEFSQNNSFGSFVVDDKLCHRLFIEAESADKANDIARSMGVYFDGCSNGLDCDCCGDRWYRADKHEEIDIDKLSSAYNKAFESVEDYAQYLANKYGWTMPDARIFYLSGETKEIYIDEN